MDGAADGSDDGTAHEHSAGVSDAANAIPFDAIVVRYESGDDRWTLVPRDGTTEKLNAWLTADLEAVVDLDDAR